MNDDHATPRPVSLGRAIKRGFRDAYDHLGYVVFATFATFIITAAVVTLTGALLRVRWGEPWVLQVPLVIPSLLVAWLCAVGVFYYANRSISHEHPALVDTWVGIKKLFVPALGVFALDFLITAVLVGDMVFFLTMFAANGTLLFAVLMILFGYLSIVWATTAMYHLPVLVAQLEMESGPRATVVLRKSFLLMADNPGFTVGLFLITIALAVLCAAAALVGMATVYLGAVAFLLTRALRELFVKYGVVEEEPESAGEEPWRLPSSWLKRDRADGDNSEETGGSSDG